TYDSRWDVMSDIWDNCPPYDPQYGCVGPHTISYHKDLLGWIPAVQKYVPAPNSSRTITMERLGQPTSTTNYLMAQLPIGASTTQFYTVEVRRFAGYDTKLPGEAVVIHKVDTTRSDRNAQVVDTDGNGNPNDSGAMWLPGETFTDSTIGATVTVNAQTATGFQVTIGLGVAASVARNKTFTVPPCRLLDTRATGGPIPANGTRSFVVAGPLSGQGGSTNCQVPRGSAKAVYVNVVAVNPAGAGHLTLYPYASLLPVASTVNFGAQQTIANGVLMPICDTTTQTCNYDLTITMGPAASDVIVDVSGYLATPP
ncbi:MAG TPA: hypothetical protein VMS64_14030, partial [Candidatus Methylomirabilis sp.]|nr:hypothetical protein [Candidatus Methylomirabilis sp.]